MDSLFFDLFEAMPRQAPGSVRATLRALSSLSIPPHKLSILDIGCGAGVQTLTLAHHLAGHILAVDNHQPFLDALKTRAEAAELRASVECRLADMRTLTFPDGSFDLVWAEGSIYIMGFAAGLARVRPFLKPGGYAVFSDMVWLTDNPPAEAVTFFAAEYPDMMKAAAVRSLATSSQYSLVDSFPVGVEDHWKTYYEPMREQVRLIRDARADSPEAQELCASLQKEIDIYSAYSSSFGYVFFIMQRT
jgi:ubiquinone/menaquinone biosynthesis C-methylase UbiE